MGTILNWNSTYPATIDDNVTNFPTVNDNVHDVLASHVNELASAVIALENVVGGLRTTVIADPLSPSSGDVLIYNSVSGEWEAGAPSGISFSLQDAYDDGNTISLTAATPVAITTSAVDQDGVTVTDGVDTVTIRGNTISLPGGQLADLSLRFDVDPTLGIYRSANNTMAFVANGAIGADVAYEAVSGITQFRTSFGTETVPGMTFRGDDDTGFYRVSTDIIGLTVGGTRFARFDAAQMLAVTGTVTTPTYSFSGDGDTGVYNPSGDTVAITAGGADIAHFRTDGLGANPQIYIPNGSTTWPGMAFLGDDNTGIYLPSPARLGIAISGASAYVFRPTQFYPNGGTITLGRSTTDYWAEIWGASAEGGTTSGPNLAAYDLTAVGTNAGAYAIGINTTLLANVAGTTTDLMSALDEMDTAISAAAGSTLQGAYDGGNTITLAEDTPITMSLTTSNGSSVETVFSISLDATAQNTAGDGYNVLDLSITDPTTIASPGDQNFIKASTDATLVYQVDDAGRTYASAGSSGVPGYSFVDYPTVGMRAQASNDLRFVVAGNDELRITSTLLAPLADGGLGLGHNAAGYDHIFGRASGNDVTGPSFTWAGDSDTGMYKPLADVSAMTSGGTEVVRFSAPSGLTPQAIFADGTGAAPSVTFSTDSGLGLYYHATGVMAFTYGGARRILFGTNYLRHLTIGSETVPTYSWVNDTDTGIYTPTSDVVGITGGGTEVVRFSAPSGLTPQAQFASGSFGNPSITFASATSTGLYLSGTDIQVAVGGSDTWNFANDQNLYNFGSGAILNDFGTLGNPAYSFDGDDDTGIYRSTNNTINMVCGGDNRMTINVNATQIIDKVQLSNGLEATPAYVWITDTDTGWWKPLDGWEGTGMALSVSGDEVARFENDNAWDDGNLQITKDLVESTGVEQVWQADASGGPSFVDETTDANSAAANDVNLFPASSATGDYVAIGMDQEFVAVVFDAAGGTGGTNQPTITWEYWNGSTWAALSILVDDTNGFSNTNDDMLVRWERPSDWATTSLNSVTKYYVRARISVSQFTTSPIYDEIKVVGDQIGIHVNVVDAGAITTGATHRVDGVRVSGFGAPTGSVQLRPFVFEYEGAIQASIETKSGGGTLMFLPQANNPAYCFIDGTGFADEGIGYGADTGQQRLLMYTSAGTESFRVESAQVFGNDGTAAAPGYAFISEDDVGLYRPAANQLGLAAQGEAVIVDNDSATPSFRPDADDTWTLGEAALRWADLYSVTTTVGDLIMHDPDEGEDSPFLILREAHETIEVYDVQSNKKFVIPLQEVQMTPEDQERINKARAKFYGDK